jgi:hypothetical protein
VEGFESYVPVDTEESAADGGMSKKLSLLMAQKSPKGRDGKEVFSRRKTMMSGFRGQQ